MGSYSNFKAGAFGGKIKEGKKVREKSKSNDLSFLDLVASLAAKGNGLNALNVWDLTYYAFNDQFKRMQAIEDYEQSLHALQQGADPKKVKLDYWVKNIQEKKK